jgi:hypothetical protein
LSVRHAHNFFCEKHPQHFEHRSSTNATDVQFAAVYLAIGALLLVSLSLIALPIVPFTSAGLLRTNFHHHYAVPCPPFRCVRKEGIDWWSCPTLHFVPHNLSDSITATVARLLSKILPGGHIPLSVSVLLTAGGLVTAIAATEGFDDDDVSKFGFWFIGGVAVVAGI